MYGGCNFQSGCHNECHLRPGHPTRLSDIVEAYENEYFPIGGDINDEKVRFSPPV